MPCVRPPASQGVGALTTFSLPDLACGVQAGGDPANWLMGIIERIEFFPKFLFVFAPASSLLIAAGGLPTSRRLGVRSGLTGSLICDVCAPISSTKRASRPRAKPYGSCQSIDDVKRAASTVDRGITPGRDDHSQQEAKCYQGARDKPAWDQVFGHAREPVSESEVPISYYTRPNIARQTGT